MSTYVYGIARTPSPSIPDGLTGVGDPPRPVRVLKEGGLVAVVSEAPDGLKPKRRELLAHQQVLAQAGAEATVLPMRFGSVSEDDEKVTSVLAERAEHFRERLDALEGKAEYNIKAVHDDEAVLHRVMADQPDLRALSEANRAAGGGSYEDRLRLGEMVANAVQAREAVDGATLRRALEPLAADISEGPESSGWLANLSFLVDKEAAGELLAAVEELGTSEPQLDLRVSGPLPPYSFVEKTGAAADASGFAAG
ncbi:GvpL/GvpF family gas vesicle protein [Streptomyces sp. NBC_01795]|uniref:GvpL/GvpF family gas vesicle protein n=1 Tax=Streptomyces sp. NBC_01795 TaxID=2975943 RepID=UPI002DD88A0B|nr:GvpL/GvpF family gas vesicle protein [Streptomyces sp. NBC_01795]WSA95820.1 GvpL/GvpF family gas vesicle protein [Streptomyces sp. NBC_01795]